MGGHGQTQPHTAVFADAALMGMIGVAASRQVPVEEQDATNSGWWVPGWQERQQRLRSRPGAAVQRRSTRATAHEDQSNDDGVVDPSEEGAVRQERKDTQPARFSLHSSKRRLMQAAATDASVGSINTGSALPWGLTGLPTGGPSTEGVVLPLDLTSFLIPIPAISRDLAQQLVQQEGQPGSAQAAADAATHNPLPARASLGWADTAALMDVGPAGLFSTAHEQLPNKKEVPGTLVLAPVTAAGRRLLASAEASNQGLNVGVVYGQGPSGANLTEAERAALGASAMWGVAQGFLNTTRGTPRVLSRLQITDAAQQGVSLHLGNVTLTNMPWPDTTTPSAAAGATISGQQDGSNPYSVSTSVSASITNLGASSSSSKSLVTGANNPDVPPTAGTSPKTVTQADVWLPSGLVASSVVVRHGAHASAAVVFDVRLMLPEEAKGPVDAGMWLRSRSAGAAVLQATSATDTTPSPSMPPPPGQTLVASRRLATMKGSSAGSARAHIKGLKLRGG